MIVDSKGKTEIKFMPESIDQMFQKNASGWGGSNRSLLFVFSNNPDRLHLNLYVGPAPTECRNRIIECCQQNDKLFNKSRGRLGAKYTIVYQRRVVGSNNYQDLSLDEAREKTKDVWIAFLADDLPRIVEHFHQHWRE